MIDRVLIASRLDGDEVGEPVPVRFEHRNGELVLSIDDMELALASHEVERVMGDLTAGPRLAEAA